MQNPHGEPGLYIVLDGIIGCGKSAQIHVLKDRLLYDFPNHRFVFTYEPGGTPEADVIRQKLIHEQMSGEEEVKLLIASRAITLPTVVRPALARGDVVISDRSVTTSLAYQGFGGRGLGGDAVWQANKEIVGNTLPDLIIWLNVGIETALARSASQDPDKFDKEDREFWEKNIRGFENMIEFIKKISPLTRVLRIDDSNGSLSIEQIAELIRETLYPLIRALPTGPKR